MTRIIVFCNLKGGVGKTTCALNLSAGLARKKYKVLNIDMDPQGNNSVGWLGPEVLLMSRGTMTDVIGKNYIQIDTTGRLKDIIKHTEFGVDIAPSNLSLGHLELILGSDPVNGPYVLREALEPVKREYDYVVIDTGPSLGYLTINALNTADNAIIPVPPEFYPMVGLSEVTKVLMDVQKSRRRQNEILNINILLTLVRETLILSKDIMSKLRIDFSGNILKTRIRSSTQLAAAPGHSKPIFDLDPKGAGSEDYMQLTEEVINDVAPPTK